ncbi:LysR substrate-binding domain-containing protein [Azoarcus olearius]|uniref:Transcriptional regulator, LysR family n=1 Tax=Azoarcus sp. (strain BH72) TaxID=418699 RepID=A1K9S8_AZOSB|nr:LysR substrate-binding domain-containing protein [Azoarcus olearius]CAL95583.1 transcriptional regulator, LysR family [Azoarcus olearius]
MASPITLDALRVLDAIDRKQSFAAAAEALFRVPSALSYTVSKLEEDLGVQLFDRSKRRAVLTPAGRLVLEQGRHILTATEELTRLVQAVGDGWEVELRIAVDSVLDFAPIYALVAEFQTLQHRTELLLSEEVLGGSWDALNTGRCDLVIGAAGEAIAGGIATRALGEVEFVFAVAAGHPLCALAQPLATEALLDFPTVVVADSSRYLPARSTGLLDGRSRVVVPSIARKIEAQCLGLGVGYLPRHRIGAELAAGTLCELSLEKAHPPQALSIAWRSAARGKALRWFLDRLAALRFDSRAGLVPVSG